jgi:hypothetical protein
MHDCLSSPSSAPSGILSPQRFFINGGPVRTASGREPAGVPRSQGEIGIAAAARDRCIDGRCCVRWSNLAATHSLAGARQCRALLLLIRGMGPARSRTIPSSAWDQGPARQSPRQPVRGVLGARCSRRRRTPARRMGHGAGHLDKLAVDPFTPGKAEPSRRRYRVDGPRQVAQRKYGKS